MYGGTVYGGSEYGSEFFTHFGFIGLIFLALSQSFEYNINLTQQIGQYCIKLTQLGANG